jgi:hypothetical protein
MRLHLGQDSTAGDAAGAAGFAVGSFTPHQQEVCRLFATRGADEFSGLA